MNPNRLVLWAGSYTDPDFPVTRKGLGITSLEFDPTSGELRVTGVAATTINPSYLAVHPNGRFVFAVNEILEAGKELPGLVTSFEVAADGRTLKALSSTASEGSSPCHLVLDPTGRHLFVANYSSGTVTHLPVGADGRLGPAARVERHQGAGPHERQRGPHAHMVAWSRTGRELYAVDLGIDAVVATSWNTGTGTLGATTRGFATAPGAGPRHLVLHPTLDRVFVVNELNATVEVFAVDPSSGSWTPVQSVSTTGAAGGYAGCAAIRISADGRFLYTSNRGDFQSLSVFAVDPTEGTLDLIQTRPSGGRAPRDLVLDPTGHFVLVANQDPGTVAVFRRDPETGLLSGTGRAVSVPTVVSLVFAV
jgi:6-phosphogluconolactonase